MVAPLTLAQNSEEIQEQIQKLKEEVAELQKQLNLTGEQKQTLQTAIKELDLQIKKLTKNISLTSTQIGQKDKEITTISGNILTTTERIDLSQGGIAQSLRELQSIDQRSAVVVLLGGGTLSSFFDEQATLLSLRTQLQNQVRDLSSLKDNLETNRSSAENRRRELSVLQSRLSQEKRGVGVARTEQDKLLTETKNQENAYQKLIAEKERQQLQFEKELLELEAGLGLTVGAGEIPRPAPGILIWPVAAPRITQYFGFTSFATANPQVYGGRGHNAIDLRAPDGTPLLSARAGVVQATGNTDLQRGCYSYGKWILLRHDNGLSTLYAHLSVLSVSHGQAVEQGELVGYSGRTGYATGPHLHFGVFASAGVKVAQFAGSVNCKQVSVPLVDPSAYLNPLSYLPTL